MGREPKLTPEIVERLLGLIRLGNFREAACQACGISSRTLRIWLVKGEKGGTGKAAALHRLLYEGMPVAEAEAEAFAVSDVRKAGKYDWKASAWFLARKFPDRWGDRLRIDLKKELDAATEDLLQIVEDVLGKDSANTIWEEIARRRGLSETEEEQGGSGEAAPS